MEFLTTSGFYEWVCISFETHMDPYADVGPEGGMLSQKLTIALDFTEHMGDVMHVFGSGFTLFHWLTDGGSDVQRSEAQQAEKKTTS